MPKPTGQAKRVLAILVGNHRQAHLNDADWNTNPEKNYCNERHCMKAFCEACAPVVVYEPNDCPPIGPITYWCEEHAP